MEALRWEGLSSAEIEAGEWIWQSSGAAAMMMMSRMEAVQVHDSNCGLDDEGGQQHTTSAVEKKKGEENRACLCHVPVDVWSHIFLQLSSFKDMAWASAVCRKWKQGMREALAYREKLSFAGWRTDDCTVGRLVEGATNLLELDM
ncbi:hypothetical protein Mapa_015152 [Marchantia paleacea]|nr:hypothetical protein Mapa_015152 [Marchantia paleacea]